MTLYKPNTSIRGTWIKSKDVVSGSKVEFVSEVRPEPSNFPDKNGNPKMRDVGKIHFIESGMVYNTNVNRASIAALVDAYGEDSSRWLKKPLTVITERLIVGDRRVVALYFVPDGYEVKEDENGFMTITNSAKDSPGNIPF